MAKSREPWTEKQVEQLLGRLLQIGVILATAVVLVGGVLFLARYGDAPTKYRVFRGEPAELRTPMGILTSVPALRSRAVIQFGVLLLIGTPVARVLVSAYAFARQRDWMYVALTIVVLGVLLYGLFGDVLRQVVRVGFDGVCDVQSELA